MARSSEREAAQTDRGHQLKRKAGDRASANYTDHRPHGRIELLPEGPADAGDNDANGDNSVGEPALKPIEQCLKRPIPRHARWGECERWCRAQQPEGGITIDLRMT